MKLWEMKMRIMAVEFEALQKACKGNRKNWKPEEEWRPLYHNVVKMG